jgi:hypothetical protein
MEFTLGDVASVVGDWGLVGDRVGDLRGSNQNNLEGSCCKCNSETVNDLRGSHHDDWEEGAMNATERQRERVGDLGGSHQVDWEGSCHEGDSESET